MTMAPGTYLILATVEVREGESFEEALLRAKWVEVHP